MAEVNGWEDILKKPVAVSISNNDIDTLARQAGYTGENTLDFSGEIAKLPENHRKVAVEAFLGGLDYLIKQQPLDNESLLKALLDGKISALAATELGLAHKTPSHMQTENMVARFFRGVFQTKIGK